jgi:hypothetical protein
MLASERMLAEAAKKNVYLEKCLFRKSDASPQMVYLTVGLVVRVLRASRMRGLKLLVYEALRYWCMMPQASGV